MIDPLAGMLWMTAVSAFLLAYYFWVSASKGAHTQPAGSTTVSFSTPTVFKLDTSVITLGAIGAFVAITGLWMIMVWPLVSSYNILFGEIYTAYGFLLLSGAVAVAKGFDLKPLSIFGGIMGIWGLIDAYGILVRGMTSEPTIAAGLYIMGALAGFLSIPATFRPSKATAVAFIVFAVLFGLFALAIGAPASFEHLSAFAKYSP